MEYYGTSFWAPTNTLAHYGVLGMKWGVRRYQNADGSFNAAGKRRYFSNGSGENYKPVRSAGGNARRALAKVYSVNEKYYSKHGNKTMANANKQAKEQMLKKASQADKDRQKRIEARNTEEAIAKRKENTKKALKIGAAAVGTALVAYGAYKVYSNQKMQIAEAQKWRDQVKRGQKMFDMMVNDAMNNPIPGATRTIRVSPVQGVTFERILHQ